MSPRDEPSRGSHGRKCGQAPWEQRRGREKAPGPESRVFLSMNLRDQVVLWRCGRLAVPCGVVSSVPASVTAGGPAHPASGPLQGRLPLSANRCGRGGGEGSGRLSRGVLVYSLSSGRRQRSRTSETADMWGAWVAVGAVGSPERLWTGPATGTGRSLCWQGRLWGSGSSEEATAKAWPGSGEKPCQGSSGEAEEQRGWSETFLVGWGPASSSIWLLGLFCRPQEGPQGTWQVGLSVQPYLYSLC